MVRARRKVVKPGMERRGWTQTLTRELAGVGDDCLEAEGKEGAGETSEGSGLQCRMESGLVLTETGMQVWRK